MAGAAICEEVRKEQRGGIEALEVPRWSVFGLLGPTGAGKGTLVKILLTIDRKVLCRALTWKRCCGLDAAQERHAVGYIAGTSLGFEAVLLLLLAAWGFCRKDY